MLQMRPGCECCNADLGPGSADARICSFECTFCAVCAETRLAGTCPNCGGELLPRPRRPAAKLARFPASTERVFKPVTANSPGAADAERAGEGAAVMTGTGLPALADTGAAAAAAQAVRAASAVPPRTRPSNYPEPFAALMAGRLKRALGDAFGLVNFGVNLTRLAPGAVSALRHAHSRQDEFIYILAGRPTLHTDAGTTRLAPGLCAGFRAGTGDAHRLINTGEDEVIYLEVGDRTPDDHATYPDDDIEARSVDGRWRFTHKDGTPYPG